MDDSNIVAESINFTREVFFGKLIRWPIFILCSLPFALIDFSFNPSTIIISLIQVILDPNTIGDSQIFNWEKVNWGAIILIVGILLTLILSGYMVRIFRGIKPAPDFDNWRQLFIDGIKLTIVSIFWFIPLTITLVPTIVLHHILPSNGNIIDSPMGIIVIFIALCIIDIVLFLVSILYALIGVVRFARTNSIREGIRFSAITHTIRQIGWSEYISALFMFCIVGTIFWTGMAVIDLIPSIGWVIVLIFSPFFTVFFSRYITIIYEHGERPVAQPVPESTLQ
jgi:hypothetical protein